MTQWGSGAGWNVVLRAHVHRNQVNVEVQAEGKDLAEKNLGLRVMNGALAEAVFHVLIVDMDDNMTMTSPEWGELTEGLQDCQSLQEADVLPPVAVGELMREGGRRTVHATQMSTDATF